MASRRVPRTVWRLAALLAAVFGCAPAAPPPTTLTWVVAQGEPRFDPGGPADPVRWMLERLLSEGLVAEDTAGRIVGAAARRWDVTPDGLTYTFSLRAGLRFEDGRECTSADFRRAIEAGLNRVDHGLYAWLLSPVVGVERVRPGRPLPSLGIATPDPRTLVLRLVRADPTLLQTLALPGASAPWSPEAGGGGWGGGVGSYRLVLREPGRRMVLARRAPGAGPDTVRVEFVSGAARARALLRRGQADLLWPVPPGMLAQPPPAGYRTAARPAAPARRLWLVMRADRRPTSKLEARRALAHGLNRARILAALAPRGGETGEWLAGGAPFLYPRHDPGRVREWLARGRLGRSLHAVMAYASEGLGGEVASVMQAEWAAMNMYVELRPLRGRAMAEEALGRGRAHLLLMETQAPRGDPVAELAALVTPRRDPPVGPFRTGWATREFDPWIGPQPPATPLDLAFAQRRLAEELIALPLARLPWLWVERGDPAPIVFHPRFGPGPGPGPRAPGGPRQVR